MVSPEIDGAAMKLWRGWRAAVIREREPQRDG